MKLKCTFSLVFCLALWSAYGNIVLLPTGSVWKYLDNGSNQGTAWRSVSFNDAAWLSGAAQLGYGDGDEATVVNAGPSSNKYITTYFRKTISVADASIFSSYALRVRRDDGIVVYVNGTEVYRNNMPTGTISNTTRASSTASDDGNTFLTATLPAGSLQTGTNVIAVEIHQASSTSSDISFDMELTGVEGSAANEVIYQWSGAIQPTSATVVAKVTSASTTCRVRVSTSSTLASPLFSAYATASTANNFMAKMPITGLTPNTLYYYAIESGGIVDNSSDDIGTFRTPSASAFSFTFTVGSCAVNSNHPVYTLMAAKNPLFHLTTGDFHYDNPNSGTNINVHRQPYESNMLSQTPTRNFLKSTALAYMWDDHDYCGNNSGGTSSGKANARQAYQEYVPHYPLAAGTGNVPIYQAFTIGRVRFILTDLRSERASGTMMGTAQKTWFKNQCLAARDNNQIIAWVTAVSFGGNQTDNWGGFTAERTELSNFFRDNAIQNMYILSGDAHMVAIDNGTNHDFSTGANNPYDYPVFQAAAINNIGSTKGGTYSEGGTFPNPSSSTGQYGVVTVTDTGGGSITIKFTAYRTAGATTSESVLRSYTFTRALATTVTRIRPAFATRVLDNGQAVKVSWDKAIPEHTVLERSKDGNQYEEVTRLDKNTLDFTDTHPHTGWNYYRLVSGTSKTVLTMSQIHVTGKMQLSVAPNPAVGQATFTVQHIPAATPARYILYTDHMKTVQQGDVSLKEGENTFPVSLKGLPTGVYFMHVVIDGSEIVQRLVITNE